MSCSENSDGSALIGLKESGFWHDTATIDTKVKHFTPACRAYGYSVGTDDFNRCLERVITESKRSASQSTTSSQGLGIVQCFTNGSSTICKKY